jgi:hypothetical protein
MRPLRKARKNLKNRYARARTRRFLGGSTLVVRCRKLASFMPPLQPDASRAVAAYRWLEPEIVQPEESCAVTARQASFSMVKFLPRVSGTLRLQPNILAILSLAHPVIGRMRLFPANGT